MNRTNKQVIFCNSSKSALTHNPLSSMLSIILSCGWRAFIVLRLRICPTSFTENENLFECAVGLSNVDYSFKSTVILGSGPKVWTPNTHLNIVAHFINLTQQDSAPYHTSLKNTIKSLRHWMSHQIPQTPICHLPMEVLNNPQDPKDPSLQVICPCPNGSEPVEKKRRSKIRSNHVSVYTVRNNRESWDVFL